MTAPSNILKPAFVQSISRLQCTVCGAEANASCNCGKPYLPVKLRVKEYDEANPGKSTRAAAEELGVSKSEVNRARQSGVPDGTGETVTGRDGKEYPATKKKPARNEMPSSGEEVDWRTGRAAPRAVDSDLSIPPFLESDGDDPIVNLNYPPDAFVMGAGVDLIEMASQCADIRKALIKNLGDLTEEKIRYVINRAQRVVDAARSIADVCGGIDR